CHQLAVRALREELGLTNPRDYYNNIVFSWFGFYAPDASTYFFAHVKTRLEEDELVQRATSAESAFEIESIDWCDLDQPTIIKVLSTWQDGPWAAGKDDQGRQYLPHATVSLTQLWRVTQQHML
ncbi:NUDIX hydrolase, partial [Streptomyces virginiae]|uniref:NUDIX hydrolase n=1 Tax=Streptomyces virginiae TaxID=1961 RepID=UPI0036F11625